MHICFFFFPEQYQLHAKQGDAASARNFFAFSPFYSEWTLFCVFWKRFVSNGGTQYTLLLVCMNSLVWICWFVLFPHVSPNPFVHFFRWSWWLRWTWPEWHPFPSWGFCPWSQLYLGSIWVKSPMQPQSSWAKKGQKRRFMGEVSTKWVNIACYCCGTRRLMINNQSVKSSAALCVYFYRCLTWIS